MIQLQNISKRFEEIEAVRQVSLSMQERNVFGLIGTNGAGKTTLLRMIAGIIRPDSGEVLIDDRPVFDNEEAIRDVYFIPDEPYFFRNANGKDMERYFTTVYRSFDSKGFYEYLDSFGLEKDRKISTFSKGMQKQMAILLGLCTNTKYLICDETFDGLDPVVRQGIKGIFAKQMEERGLTPIIASHNLRELEDICDTVGLLHKGGVLLSKDLLDMKCNIQKVQCVFSSEEKEEAAIKTLEVLQREKRGRLLTLTVRGHREELDTLFAGWNPVFYEILPLSLEEIFISETEVVGYDIKKLIFS